MELLNKTDYHKLSESLQQVTINNLFARAVIEQKVNGQVFVDDADNPSTFYVIHPYGMTLLFGNSNNPSFNNSFKVYALNQNGTRDRHEWMQAFPNSWDPVLRDLFGETLIPAAHNTTQQEKGIIELNTRVNFTFNKAKFLANRKTITDPDIRIIPANGELFREMKGSVIPANFWNNEADFLKNGLAYCLFYQDQLASMAFSSFWFGNQFELGIETIADFRGKGYAEQVCAALIDYCLANEYEPIWACRLENTGSYQLALKLGFEVCRTVPYYRLSS